MGTNKGGHFNISKKPTEKGGKTPDDARKIAKKTEASMKRGWPNTKGKLPK